MAKVIVVYESKFGNTKLAGETIVEGLKEAGADAVISELKEVDPNELPGFDAILIGSPTHMGSATRGIRKFIDKLGKLDLEGKLVAFFDCRAGPEPGKAVGKMEQQLAKKAPGMKLAAPGLSIMVSSMKGPIIEGDLARCKEFGSKIAGQLKG